MAVTVTTALPTRRITRLEYERLTELGFFDPDERLELLDGIMVVREPQKSPHATAVRLVQRALEQAFGPGWDVRSQLPVALDDVSEPEPDAAVVPGDPRDYAREHPARPVLVVEVTGSSLLRDRVYKASLYARAGLSDYWVVTLASRVVEVHREPEADSEAVYGWRYRSIERLAPPSTVTPLAAPHARIPVADLLP